MKGNSPTNVESCGRWNRKRESKFLSLNCSLNTAQDKQVKIQCDLGSVLCYLVKNSILLLCLFY